MLVKLFEVVKVALREVVVVKTSIPDSAWYPRLLQWIGVPIVDEGVEGLPVMCWLGQSQIKILGQN